MRRLTQELVETRQVRRLSPRNGGREIRKRLSRCMPSCLCTTCLAQTECSGTDGCPGWSPAAQPRARTAAGSPGEGALSGRLYSIFSPSITHECGPQARKEAVARARELEDVIALKNSVRPAFLIFPGYGRIDGRQLVQMFDTLERQLDLLEKHTAELQRKEAELVALRAEQAEQPISANDLAHRYAQLSDLFTQLQDTLTCPVCYEPFGRGQAVSLQCGHNFCQPVSRVIIPFSSRG